MCSAGESPNAFFLNFNLVQPQGLQWTAEFKHFISDLQLVCDALGGRDMGFVLQGTALSPHPEGICHPSCKALKQHLCCPVKHTWRITSLSALCGDGSLSSSWFAGSFQWPEEESPQEWPQEWQKQHFSAMCTASPYHGLLFSPHEWSLNSLRHSRERANRLFP